MSGLTCNLWCKQGFSFMNSVPKEHWMCVASAQNLTTKLMCLVNLQFGSKTFK